MVSAHFISTTKTARYFTLGQLTPDTREIWFVLHGYAQLASDFIKPFEAISSPKRVIIAPEGLNKFYAKGFGGKPAATWMTSEMREEEITDYINYLNTLYRAFVVGNKSTKIVLLGFSQGVATASRWLHHTGHKVDSFIAYSGEIAAELRDPVSPKLLSLPVTYVTGNNDRLITQEKLTEVKTFMLSLSANEIVFDGGHEVLSSVLKQISER